jgi:thermolysin
MSWSARAASPTRLAVSALAIGLAAATVGTAQRAVVQPQFIAPSDATDLRARDQQVERMLRGGELRVRQVREDLLASGVTHERSDQFHRGVRVVGGDVARQIDGGRLRSVYGVVYQGIDLDTAPEIDVAGARALVEQRTGVRLAPAREPELVVLPLDEGGYALAWSARVRLDDDVRQMFFDAGSGRLLLEYSDLQTQAGTSVRATGVLGDGKKISVLPSAGQLIASDRLRPPSLITYDMKGDHQRTEDVLDGFVQLGPGDIATDSKTTWSDGAVVDAHAYAGFTYDYYFKRFGRRGLDNADKPIKSLVHPVRRNEVFDLFSRLSVFFSNAAYFGDGVMVYGVGLPPGTTSGGRSWDFTSGALDIVAHELTHGVTDYTSNLIYRNESGALNEAFSDIMATGVEFFFQPAGGGTMQADYLCAEDVVRNNTTQVRGIRSLENPGAYGHPDHYAIRFLGTSDNGGVHINSGIANQAFYLAVEGGTNRTSGLSVQGVGGGNREQIEKVFYRAFTQMLPSNATFSIARAATIQAARDLYGANSAAERAVTQAWTAVGVQ